MDLVRLLGGKFLHPIQDRPHREQAALAMSDQGNGAIVFLQVTDHSIELCRLIFEGRDIAIKCGLKPVKDKVIVPVETGIVEDDSGFPPGIEIVANEPMDKQDHILRLKDAVT